MSLGTDTADNEAYQRDSRGIPKLFSPYYSPIYHRLSTVITSLKGQ